MLLCLYFSLHVAKRDETVVVSFKQKKALPSWLSVWFREEIRVNWVWSTNVMFGVDAEDSFWCLSVVSAKWSLITLNLEVTYSNPC